MKTFKIEDARTKYFKSKEHYTAFLQSWKDASNSAMAKPTIERTPVIQGRSVIEGVERKKGWLKTSHHIIFNLLRGKEAGNGFTPVTREKKLKVAMCGDPDFAFNYALRNSYPSWSIESIRRHYVSIYELANKSWEEEYEKWKAKNRWTLERLLRKNLDPKEVKIKQWNESIAYQRNQIEHFLQPFNGTVSYEMLKELIEELEAAK